MALSSMPRFEDTPTDSIPNIASGVRHAFLTHRTRPLEWRKKQLRKLYWGLVDNEEAIAEACKQDLNKSGFETYLAESGWCKNDILYILKNLDKWAEDETAPDIPLTNKLVFPKIRKDPVGVVLVLGAYNFPFQLSLGPLIGAIAAGCSAVLKPSENAPAAAVVMQKIVADCLDSTAFTVVQGGIPCATALLDQKWDKIFYTGSANVGTIIAKKAAETLTPVTLELGGKNPAIVTKHADPRLAARRLLWAKLVNAGQVCVSQNYILVDRDILPALVDEMKKALKEFFPQGTRDSPDYGRIINERQWSRLKKMLDGSTGKILIGGEMDEKEKYLAPTVVQVNDINDSLLTDESFGPLIPIYAVSDLDEAIRLANEIDPTPLGVYPFGDKKETAKVLAQTRSGGASINDGFFHASIPTLQFGGVGTSGQGSYRGKASFDTFTHRRSYTSTPGWMESLIAIRYPPYKGKTAQFRKMTDGKPDFDREGKQKFSLTNFIFTLGGGSAGSGLRRYVLVALLAVGVRQVLARQHKL